MKCCLFAFVVRPEDDKTTVFNKKLLMVTGIANMLGNILELSTTHNAPAIRTIRRCVALATGAFVVAQLLIERKLRHTVMEATMYMMSMMLLLASLESFNTYQGWPLFVVLIDICLVCKLKPRVAKNVILSLTVWLVLSAIENAYRFGLYDLSVVMPQEDRKEAVACDCGELPCKRTIHYAATSLFYQLAVVLLDFYFTRGFARGMHREHECMNQAIQATEDIATSLSRFDLASAEDIIESASLPPPLHHAFSGILANLHIYRPYLPQSCFFTDDEVEESLRVEMGDSEQLRRKSSAAPRLNSSLTDPPTVLAKVLERKRCSFTVTNMLGSIGDAASDPAAYQEKYKHFMECLSEKYIRLSGVVGAVVGDHVHASFNTTKRCASHAKNAVQAAVNLYDRTFKEGIEVVTGVSSGTAFCGSLGCSEIMSVGMIGTPSITASVLQDLGRSGGYKVVCCSTVYSEVSFAFTMKIILTRVKVNKHKTEIAYRVLEVEDKRAAATGQEWMYELEEKPWESYNSAGKLFMLGDREEALRVLRIEREKPAKVAAAENDLEQLIKSGTFRETHRSFDQDETLLVDSCG